MSDGAPAREWRFYVEDMLDFCGKVGAYTQGLDRASTQDNLAPLRDVLTKLLATRP